MFSDMKLLTFYSLRKGQTKGREGERDSESSKGDLKMSCIFDKGLLSIANKIILQGCRTVDCTPSLKTECKNS